METIRKPFFLFLLLITLGLGLNAAAATLTVNGAQQFQTIDGFGVNVNSAWWLNGAYGSTDVAKPAIDMLVNNLGATIFRAVIEEMDWEPVNDDADPNHFNWTYYNSVFTSTKFQGVWNTLRYLNQKGITDRLMISFMGTPPSWMGPNYTVSSANEDEFVESIAALLYYARYTAGIQFTLVSPLNETEQVQSGWLEGPNMPDAVQTARVLEKLALKLDAIGMSDIRFVGPDAAGDSNFQSCLTEMVKSPEIMGKLHRWGVHQYGSDVSGYNSTVQGTANKSFWVTETCGIENMIGQLDDHAEAIIFWDGFDSVYQHGKHRDSSLNTPPNDWCFWMPGDDGKPLIAYNAATQSWTPRKQFYQFAQLFKFVLPGAQRIGATGNDANLVEYAYRNLSGQVVIFGRNQGAGAITVSGTLTGLPTVSSFALYQTNASMNLQRGNDVTVTGGAFSFTVAAGATFTLAAGSGTAAPVITSSTTATGAVGDTFNYQITAYNSPTSYSATGLPAGLTANASTGVISGIPSATGTTSATIRATNAFGTGTATLVITVTLPKVAAPTFSPVPGTYFSAQTATISCATGGATVRYTTNNTTPTQTAGTIYSGPLAIAATTTLNAVAYKSGMADSNVTSGVYSILPPGSAVSLWSSSTTPSVVNENDTAAVELGVKFYADVSGTVTGVRFYKGPANTGTHVGNLWTAAGAKLATATFANETASGWQQVNFATPVAISAGTTYVASSFAPNGRYAADTGYFTSSYNNVPLHAPVNAGVYAYGPASSFPNQSYQSGNYWVDVVVVPGGGGGSAPVITSGTTANGTVGTAFSYPITATNSPTSYGAIPLPAGLSVDAATGVISGTPTATGTTNVSLKAINTSGTGTATLKLTVNPSGSALVTANFTAGNTATSPDGYVGMSGNGWAGAWNPLKSGSCAFANTVLSGTALGGGGNYLNINLGVTGTAAGAFSGATGRKFDTAVVSGSSAYTISYKIRLDSSLANGSDMILILGDVGTGYIFGTGPNNTFVISGQYNNGSPVWKVANGTKAGASAYVDTGVALTAGTVYTMSVKVYPATKDWTLDINHGAYTSGTLGFRTAAAAGNAGNSIYYGATVRNTTGTLKYSVDTISITQP